MTHYILIFLKYTFPGIVIAGFAVRCMWLRAFGKKQ